MRQVHKVSRDKNGVIIRDNILKNNEIFIKNFLMKKGGLLDKSWTYFSSITPFFITCQKGHKWRSNWQNIYHGTWCPECAGHVIHEEDVKNIIENKGGKVNETWSYVNAKTKFGVKCSQGHFWLTCWDKINQGRWCPECAGHIIHEEDIKKLINNKGWIFDKNWRYKGAWEKIDIICSKGHKFKISSHDLKKGIDCAECKGLKVHEKEIREIIENKKGILGNSWVYKNNREKIKITCSKGHTWETPWKVIKKGHWCPYCSGKIVLESDVREVVTSKGGILEKDWKYINCDTRFLVTCKKGHKFKTCWDHIKQKHWCHYCNSSHGEKDFRDVIEEIFQKRFEKVRPEWLRISSSRSMELDGYNEELSIAFEYQGQQHYSRKWFRISEEDFQKQQERDRIKKELCEKRGIRLIIVPYYYPKSKWVNLIGGSVQVEAPIKFTPSETTADKVGIPYCSEITI